MAETKEGDPKLLIGCALRARPLTGINTVLVTIIHSIDATAGFHSSVDDPSARMPESATTAPESGKKPLYEGSTQFKNWRFSKEQLAQKRSALNVAAVEAVRRVIENDTACSLAPWSASFLTLR